MDGYRRRVSAPPPARTPWLRFDRHELAGAFGDLGTDLPLLIGLIATCGLDAASVLIVFGALQITTGLGYGIPMPVQPLKAMAAIMLAQRLSPAVFAAGGVVIGVAMLALTLSGLLDKLIAAIPKVAVRGVQLGLGLQLATLALKDYVARDGARGYVLAGVCFAALLVLRRQQRVPGPLIVIAAGVAYALIGNDFSVSLGLHAPRPVAFGWAELRDGALLLALPQLPLSLGNSVAATSQTSRDLFPERPASVRKIGLSYGLMNVVGPLVGGVPVCHGCGGLVGFAGFGARTGGAPVIYGSLYLIAGVFFAGGVATLAGLFPMPLLGVVMLFEAILLMLLTRDVAGSAEGFWIALAVAMAVVALPYGYLIGLLLGWGLDVAHKRGWLRLPVPHGPNA